MIVQKKGLCAGLNGVSTTNLLTNYLNSSNFTIVYGTTNGAGGASLTCWNPFTGAQTTACSASQWQCSVKYLFLIIILEFFKFIFEIIHRQQLQLVLALVLVQELLIVLLFIAVA